jgi:two-component system cell cycle sensor histidine kinase PleC
LLGGTGVDLVRYIRNFDNTIPIVVLTGCGSEADAVNAIKLGANDYLVKDPATFVRLPVQISVAIAAERSEISRRQTLAELNDLQKRFRDFAEAASDWFWEKNADLRFTYVSDGVRELFGREPGYFIGRRLWDIVESCSAEELELHEQAVLKHSQFRDVVCRVATPKDADRIVRISGKPWHDESGAFMGYRGIGTDITKQRWNEEEVRRAKESAEAASAAKTNFLAIMSHELRTPLNAIIGFSQVLDQGIGGSLSTIQKDYLKDIRVAGEQLLSLVNDLLDLSKIEAGKYELAIERLLVASVVADVAGMLSGQAKVRSVSLVIADADPGLEIDADPRALRQMLQNLLSNAIKFTPAGGSVTVTTAICGETVEITVADTGIGISPEDIDRITEPFHQIDNVMTRKHDGTGLGLSIVSGLIGEHGGTIEIASEPGRGTSVTLVFPLFFNSRK